MDLFEKLYFSKDNKAYLSILGVNVFASHRYDPVALLGEALKGDHDIGGYALGHAETQDHLRGALGERDELAVSTVTRYHGHALKRARELVLLDDLHPVAVVLR